MKVVGINGSTRKGGNTAEMIKKVFPNWKQKASRPNSLSLAARKRTVASPAISVLRIRPQVALWTTIS